jgi:hypothetical protein
VSGNLNSKDTAHACGPVHDVTNNPQVTEFLRKEILRKNEKIASLEAILEQREILVEQEKAAFIKHAEQKVNGA